MAQFKKISYGGSYPVCTDQPIALPGGFNLDKKAHSFEVGAVIPAGTLAVYDETTRLVRVLKTARVKDVSADFKVLILENSPLFKVGDMVANKLIENSEEAAIITKIDISAEGYEITLAFNDNFNPSFKIGDVLQQAIDSKYVPAGSADMKLTIGTPTAVVMNDTLVKDLDSETGIDVSMDSGAGLWYLKRIPPVPDSLIENNLLKANHNIKFTNSL